MKHLCWIFVFVNVLGMILADVDQIRDSIHDLPSITWKDTLYQTFILPQLQPMDEQLLPLEVDLRRSGLVTPIKTQGSCGSCSMHTTAAICETLLLRSARIAGTWLSPRLDLSEQYLIDCDTQSLGCRGGWFHWSAEMVARSGIPSESVYPYRGIDEECIDMGGRDMYHPLQGVGAATLAWGEPMGEETERLMRTYVAAGIPVAVGVHAGDTLINYQGGVITGGEEGDLSVNHQVLVVGYGNKGGHDCYIVKNSWGRKWGHGGYFYIARDIPNLLRIQDHVVVPLIPSLHDTTAPPMLFPRPSIVLSELIVGVVVVAAVVAAVAVLARVILRKYRRRPSNPEWDLTSPVIVDI